MKNKIWMAALAVLAAALTGCGDGSSNSAQTKATNAPSSGNNPLNAAADYGNALVNAQRTAVSVTDLASLKKAIDMFNAQEGRNPKDLNELVDSKLIARIPQTPAGTKLNYDAATGTVKIVNQ